MSLDRLYQLDKSYAAQLDKLLHDVGYVESLMGLQGDELVELVNHLGDTVSRLIRIGGSYRKCLHILRKISSTRGVLPSTYEVQGTLLISGGTPIAHGGFCDAKKGTLSTTREESVCVKTLRIYSSGDRDKFKELLCKEAIVWKYLTHPNIVQFKGVTSEPPQLVSEWMSGGELRDHVKDHPDANLLDLLVGVAEGLAYLHSCDVIHGDLKGPNILVDASGNARITDFGLASIARDPSSVASNSPDSGYTMRWTAPEIFHGSTIASKKADVFSFAMVIFEVFSGKVPFPDMTAQVVPAMIMSGQRPERPTHPGLTDALWELTGRCWGIVPEDRPEMEDVIQYLKKMGGAPPLGKPPGETPATIQGASTTTAPGRKPIHKTSRRSVNGRGEITTPYDVDTPLPRTTQPTPKVEDTPLSRKGSKVVGREPASGPLSAVSNKNPSANGSQAAVEGGRVHRAPSKRETGDKGHRELGGRKSRKGPEHEGAKDAEATIKKAKATPDQGQFDPSGSTTALPEIKVTPPSRPPTPKSPPNRDDHRDMPPVPGPSSHATGENPSPPAPAPPPAVDLDKESTIRPTGDDQSESRTVKPAQVQPDPDKAIRLRDRPRQRDQPDPLQRANGATHSSQIPVSAAVGKPYETPEVVPLKRPWWKCGCC